MQRGVGSFGGVMIAALAAACSSREATPTARQPETVAASPAATETKTGTATVAVAATGTETGAASVKGAETTVQTAAVNDVRAANGFALALHVKARKPGANATFSGTSLRHALAAVAVGARGETAAQLVNALALPTEADRIADVIAAEVKGFGAAAPESGALRTPTRIWIDQAFTPTPAYVEMTRALGAGAETLPLGSKAEAARATINAWASNETAGKIPEVLGRGTIDKDTKLVVTNAVYLKARWVEPFPKDATADAAFKVLGKTDAKVPTMHLTASMRHAAVANAQLVELRYDGTPLAMLVAVPDEATGLAKLEDALEAGTLERWTKELTMKRVALSLPRFSFAAGGSMKKPLEQLGIARAFTNAADLSGIGSSTDGGKLRVGDVLQRTFIAVDELGTEAAAATGVVMRTTSLELGAPLDVKVDRPFLFVLRDTASGRVLFTGRVEDPRAR